MMFKRLPIRTRLTLLYSGLMFVALMVFAVSAIGLLKLRLTTRLEASLDSRAKGLEDFLRRETTEEEAWNIAVEAREYASTQPEGHLIELTGADGRVLLQSDHGSEPAMVRERRFQLYGQTYRARAAGSLEPVQESTRELRWLLMTSAPLLLLVIGGFGYWICGTALAPVDEMTRAASSISVHSLEQRLAVPPAIDELSRLAEAWNAMLSRLEESVSRIRRFTGDAAHELRTPLTVIRTTAELALRRQRPATEYREALQQVVRTSERMTTLADDLLTLARGDEAATAAGFGATDLCEIVQRVAAEVQPLLQEKNQELQIHLPESPAVLSADPRGLSRLVGSLLDNAIKYTPRGGRIQVRVRAEGDAFELQVIDSGSGIPDEEIPHIFDRFYRVDQSRDRQTGGHGLGLAIAQQIVHSHHGSIQATAGPGGGACFRVRFGRNRAAEPGAAG